MVSVAHSTWPVGRRPLLARLRDASAKWAWQAGSLYAAVKTLGPRQVLQDVHLKHFTLDAIRGFYTTRTLIALFNIGFFDELSMRGAIDLTDFAARHDLDLTVLKSVCDYLYALTVLDRRGDEYRLDSGITFPAQLVQGPVQVVYAYEEVFYNLEALLKKERTYGIEVHRRSEFVARGSGASGEILVFPYLSEMLDRRGFQRILDLGCGDGTFLIDQCRRNDRVTGYGVDLAPEAIAYGNKRLAEEKLQNRVTLVTMDIFNLAALAPQVRDIDAAISVFVLHELFALGPATIVDLLRTFRTCFPGIPLVLCEMIRHTPEELRQKPGGVAEIQLFHSLSNQPLLTRDEWRDLFRKAGFAHVQEEYLSFARTAIFIASQ